jgi:hypothetical protein
MANNTVATALQQKVGALRFEGGRRGRGLGAFGRYFKESPAIGVQKHKNAAETGELTLKHRKKT